jgi:hypothetical protein
MVVVPVVVVVVVVPAGAVVVVVFSSLLQPASAPIAASMPTPASWTKERFESLVMGSPVGVRRLSPARRSDDY